MKIDVHSHFVVEECSQRLSSRHDGRNIVQEASGQDSGKWNVELFKTLRDKLSDVPTRLKDMDQGGIDIQVLSPPPYMLYYWADIETGAALSKMQNDRISEICRQYPSRFIGMGTVPLQDVALANQELERMARVLNLRGVIISSNVNGKDLDDKALYPFFEKAESLGVLIFIHPHDTAAAQRMQNYYLTNLLGNPLDTAIAGSRIILSGLLAKLPRLKIFLAHGGGHLPYVMGRIHQGYIVRPECRKEISRPPWDYFRSLYFDTITHDRSTLEYLIHVSGSGQVLMGTDYPYDMAERDPVGFVSNLAIPEADKKKILGENLRGILGV